jgi:Uma2 family endonuclease
MQIYLREGVRYAWLIDPMALTFEVYRNGGDAWQQLDDHHGAVSVRAEPFEGFELHLARLWDL